jgi:hypothetical protein
MLRKETFTTKKRTLNREDEIKRFLRTVPDSSSIDPNIPLPVSEISIWKKGSGFHSKTFMFLGENAVPCNMDASMTEAVLLGGRSQKFWIVRRQVYSETEDLDAAAVWALAIQIEKTKERKLKRAFAELDLNGDSIQRREPIPDDVKIFVWQRDRGRCVKCGSDKNLEFDHIIPWTKGGSSSARNIQLLCETCNRGKGPNLI